MRSGFKDPEKQFKKVYRSAWVSMHIRFLWCMRYPINPACNDILGEVLE